MAPVPYTTPEKVRTLVSRQTDSRPGTGASISESQLVEAISAAQQKIDSVLGPVYATPFDPVPPLVTDIATALAALEADMTFREVRDYGSELNPVVLRAKRYEDLLQQLRKGEATLPGYEPPEDEPTPPTDSGSIVDVFNPCEPDVCCSSGPTWHGQYYGTQL